MNIAIDLHIHSGLSPCGDKHMTPNNIINMALLKGLDAIAITDHNCTENLKAFMQVAEKKGIICIPGVEVTTKEEVHLIAYFSCLEGAKKFQKVIDQSLPQIPNKASILGNQLLYDENDNIIGEYDYMLLNCLDLFLEEAVLEARKSGGIIVPAHVDRKGFSILWNLGFIPSNLPISTVEVSRYTDIDKLENQYLQLKAYRKIINSDAHRLENILERESFLTVKSLDLNSILYFLDHPIRPIR